MTARKKNNKRGGAMSMNQLPALQDQAGQKLAALRDQAGQNFTALQGRVKGFIPQMSVNGVLKKAFGLNDEQLAALGKSDPSMLQRAFWQSLNEKKWALVTSALGFIPFIGQDFLAAKSVYKEATEVLTDSAKKVQTFLPKTDEDGIEMQDLTTKPPSVKRETEPETELETITTSGGARFKKSNTILRRIEKSKRAFHNTNKHRKIKNRKSRKRGRKRA